MKPYPGAKTSVAKRLVSLMPPHRVYVELFLGSGAVLRLKKPADLTIGIDSDPSVIATWRTGTPGLTLAAASRGLGDGRRRKRKRCQWCQDSGSVIDDGATDPALVGERCPVCVNYSPPALCVAQADALAWIQSSPPVLRDPDTLVYLDPPYLMETRTRLFYREELQDPLRHAVLLALLQELPCMVMISHYPCALYNETLIPVTHGGWRRVMYRIQTHGGPRIEACYLNFPEPATFHDSRFLGDGFRERERMKRKSKRWQARFEAMCPAERAVVAAALAGIDRASLERALL